MLFFKRQILIWHFQQLFLHAINLQIVKNISGLLALIFFSCYLHSFGVLRNQSLDPSRDSFFLHRIPNEKGLSALDGPPGYLRKTHRPRNRDLFSLAWILYENSVRSLSTSLRHILALCSLFVGRQTQNNIFAVLKKTKWVDAAILLLLTFFNIAYLRVPLEFFYFA